MSSYRLPFVLLVFAAIYGRPGPAPVIPGGPRAALIENDGQHPGSVRYTLALDGAHAWLTGDAVWLTYAGRDATAVSGIHLKLSFGRQLDWEPYGSQAGDLCIVLPGEGGAESLRPALWSGARAVLDGGAVLTVTADGIAITGNGRSTADVTVEGGPAEIAGGGSARMVRAGERDLPMRWEVPLNVNGVPAGPHGGTAELAPPGPRPAAGSQIHFSTYIGGENGDEGEAIARDGAGNVYVAGQSLSIFFPTAPGPFTSPRHNVEAFVARLDPQGAGLEYICVIRADVEDWGTALAVDPAGNAFLFGRTDSTINFPFTPGAYDTTPNGGFDLFVMRFDQAGGLVFSTMLGGGGEEFAGGIAIDPAGNLDFWTYLGGTEDGITGDRALAVAVDTAGAVYAAGSTYAADFPTTPGAFDPDFDQTCICADGFVVKLSASGSNLLWGTFLGADGEDTVEALELDAFGHLVLAGATGSAGFPVTPDAFDVTLSGESDAFIARLDASGSILLYATYLGGSAGESARGIDVTLQGRILVTGWTDSADFPTTPGSFDPVHNFDKDVFVTVLVPPRAGAPVEVFLPLIQRKGE